MTKSKKRIKATGEVFTPAWLVNEMLDKLPPELWANSTKTYLDPACGSGNILVEVVRRKIANGHEPYWALKRTYGVDIMPDNIEECRERLVEVACEGRPRVSNIYREMLRMVVEKNIRLGNTLQFKPEDIFSDKPSEKLIEFREQAKSNLKVDNAS